MLRFRAVVVCARLRSGRSSVPMSPCDRGPAPASKDHRLVHDPGHRCQRLRRQPSRAVPPRRRSPRRRLRSDARSGPSWSSSGFRTPTDATSPLRIGDVTRPGSTCPALAGVDGVVHLAAIPRDRNDGEELRIVNTEGTRAVVAAMRVAGVDRLIHMGAMGVADDPDLHYASSKAKAEALVAAPVSPGRSSSRRSSSARATASSTSSPTSSGSRRAWSRSRVTARPASSRSSRRRRDGDRSRALADPTTIGGVLDLGGPRYWTYREITREVLTRARQAAGHPADAGPAHPARGRASRERCGLPFPVATDQLRQLNLDNIGPLGLIQSRFGF